jgi:NADPH2:quinone reductase
VPLPSGLGTEAAGVVEEVGQDVSDISSGDRVAYAGGPLGAYAEERVTDVDTNLTIRIRQVCQTSASGNQIC